MKNILKKIKEWLSRLSFRTGVIVLVMCVPFYILSSAQMALPISAGLKGVLWFILFGAAKCCQYGGLTILGVEGVAWLRKWWKEKRGK
jgi:phosphoglycolate phosphatase